MAYVSSKPKREQSIDPKTGRMMSRKRWRKLNAKQKDQVTFASRQSKDSTGPHANVKFGGSRPNVEIGGGNRASYPGPLIHLDFAGKPVEPEIFYQVQSPKDLAQPFEYTEFRSLYDEKVRPHKTARLYDVVSFTLRMTASSHGKILATRSLMHHIKMRFLRPETSICICGFQSTEPFILSGAVNKRQLSGTIIGFLPMGVMLSRVRKQPLTVTVYLMIANSWLHPVSRYGTLSRGGLVPLECFANRVGLLYNEVARTIKVTNGGGILRVIFNSTTQFELASSEKEENKNDDDEDKPKSVPAGFVSYLRKDNDDMFQKQHALKAKELALQTGVYDSTRGFVEFRLEPPVVFRATDSKISDFNQVLETLVFEML